MQFTALTQFLLGFRKRKLCNTSERPRKQSRIKYQNCKKKEQKKNKEKET